MIKKVGYVLLSLLVLFALAFAILRNPDKSLEELKPLYTDTQSKWTSINGMEAHYKVEGSGHPIVLIHGTGSSLHTWDKWTERLDDQFQVIRMDLPAFGLTGPSPDRDYTIEAYVDFVDDLITELGVDSFTIAGNSLGGYIAWAYTITHSDKVDKLILLDAAGYPHKGESTALAFQIANNPILSPLMKHITPKSFIKKNLIQVYANDDLVTDGLVTRYHDMTLRAGNRQAFIDRVHTVHKDQSESISTIKQPTLILWGKEDTWVELDHAYTFDRDISNSKLIIYDNVGHVPMEEIPEQTVEDVVAFLTKN